MKKNKFYDFQHLANFSKKIISNKVIKKFQKKPVDNSELPLNKPRTDAEIAELRRNLSVFSEFDVQHLTKHKKSTFPKIFVRIQKFINTGLQEEQKKIFSRQIMYLIFTVIICVMIAISTETYFIVKRLQKKTKRLSELQTVLNYVTAKKALNYLVPGYDNHDSMWYIHIDKILSSNFIFKSKNFDTLQVMFSISTNNLKISHIAQQLKIFNAVVNVNKGKKDIVSLNKSIELYWSYWVIPSAEIDSHTELPYNPGVGYSTVAVANTITYSRLDFDPNSYPNDKFPSTKNDLVKIIKVNQQQNFNTETLGKDKENSIHPLTDKYILLSSTSVTKSIKIYSFQFDMKIIGAGTPSRIFIANSVSDQIDYHLNYNFADYLASNDFSTIKSLSLEEYVQILNTPITQKNTSWLDSTNFMFKSTSKKQLDSFT